MVRVKCGNVPEELLKGRVKSLSSQDSVSTSNDQSDDDIESNTVHGYSYRSHESPTVRFVETEVDQKDMPMEEQEEDYKEGYDMDNEMENDEQHETDHDMPPDMDHEIEHEMEYEIEHEMEYEIEHEMEYEMENDDGEEHEGVRMEEQDEEQVEGEEDDKSDVQQKVEDLNSHATTHELDQNILDRYADIVDIEECADDYMSELFAADEDTDDIMSEATLTRSVYYNADEEDGDIHQVIAEIDAISMNSIDSITIRPEDELSMISEDLLTLCGDGEESKEQSDDEYSDVSVDVPNFYHGESNELTDDTMCLLHRINHKIDCDSDTMSTQTFDCLSEMTNLTHSVNSEEVHRRWTGGKHSVVPSLNLDFSVDSTESGPATIRRPIGPKKERTRPSYQDWMKIKERQKLEKLKAEKAQQKKKKDQSETRQRLAQQRYQEWCLKKELQEKKDSSSKGSSDRIKSSSDCSKSSSGCSKSSSGSSKSSTSISSIQSSKSGLGSPIIQRRSKLRTESTDQAKKRIEEWDRLKKIQQQRDRESQRKQQLSKLQVEQKRKQESEGAWKNWMKSVNKRAKPVPLNRGFESLRGTISNIYVNPNQWVT